MTKADSKSLLGVVYARVSPKGSKDRKSAASRAADGKDDPITSIEVQTSILEQHAARLGYTVVERFEDTWKSGASLKGRDGLACALASCKKHGATLFIYDLSRLSRGGLVDTFRTLGEITDAGCGIISPRESIDTTTAMGRAFVGFIAIINQLQREITAEKISAAMLYYQNHEHWAMGITPPYGQRKVTVRTPTGLLRKKLEPHPYEQIVIDEIVRLYRDKGLSMRRIGRILKDQGYEPRPGAKAFRHPIIRSILVRAGVPIRPAPQQKGRRKKGRPRPTVTPAEGEIVQPE